ncbi:MAG: bifunctional riboflavin kinase/FAD synthetase [Anaerolineae bacterium]|nr:bifunctional riboflavin kinase/FAD synthetase [Anaerolineae bacterium]
MELYHSLDDLHATEDTCVTVGTFDGVHRGHQSLVAQLVSHAKETGRLAGVLTFDPHPRAVLHPDDSPAYLSTLEERVALLRDLGPDLVVVAPFDLSLAAMPAERFVRALMDRLCMVELWIGKGFSLGRGREGTPARLAELGKALGYTLRMVGPVYDDGSPISSTRIRELIRGGDVAAANRLLGRCYRLSGAVISGDRRGRKLGFPTANLQPDPMRVLPADGVYAAWAAWGGACRAAVLNIGHRPSFGGRDYVLEVHVLDYEGSLYGKDLDLYLVQHLRPEMRFADIDELIAQIARDVEATRRLLQGVSAPHLAELQQDGVTELDHTADLQIRVRGACMADLLRQAAGGMFSLMDSRVAARGQRVTRQVQLEATDRESLLVDWLNELLYLSSKHHELYDEYALEVGDQSVSATLRGTDGWVPQREIKAATFHNLVVNVHGSQLEALITFDV